MEQIFISSVIIVSDIISSLAIQHSREGGRVVNSAHSAAVVEGQDGTSGSNYMLFCVFLSE